jgi:DNA-binding MarR family transcriptional regulator
VLVKDLERRGFVRRRRDRNDERRLALVLTPKGRRRIAKDTVLEPGALSAALARLPAGDRRTLLSALAPGRRSRGCR